MAAALDKARTVWCLHGRRAGRQPDAGGYGRAARLSKEWDINGRERRHRRRAGIAHVDV